MRTPTQPSWTVRAARLATGIGVGAALVAAATTTPAFASTANATAARATARAGAGPTNLVDGAKIGGARCAAPSGRQVAGTLVGRDGLGINVTIGIELKNAARQTVNMAGCVIPNGQYSEILALNHYVGADGAPVGSAMTSAQGAAEGQVTSQWGVLDVPSNARYAYVETYTRKYTGSPCGLPCAGPVDVSKYGFVNRQNLPVGPRTAALKLIADMPQKFGGDSGSLQIYIHDTSVTTLHAWSMQTDGRNNMEGWGSGVKSRTNPHIWTVPNLSPGQDYTMIAVGHPQQYFYKVTKNHVTKVVEKF